MITAWRIVKEKHQRTAFTGKGSRQYGGRWNPTGIPVIYTAESLALATLEIIVHLGKEELLYQHFIRIPVSFNASEVFTFPRRKLPKDWAQVPPSESTQTIGQKWIMQAEYAILKVPSTIIKEEHNFLINPNHPNYPTMKIGDPQQFEFDPRLIEKHPDLL
jgi:RES domain-containing protein